MTVKDSPIGFGAMRWCPITYCWVLVLFDMAVNDGGLLLEKIFFAAFGSSSSVRSIVWLLRFCRTAMYPLGPPECCCCAAVPFDVAEPVLLRAVFAVGGLATAISRPLLVIFLSVIGGTFCILALASIDEAEGARPLFENLNIIKINAMKLAETFHGTHVSWGGFVGSDFLSDGVVATVMVVALGRRCNILPCWL